MSLANTDRMNSKNSSDVAQTESDLTDDNDSEMDYKMEGSSQNIEWRVDLEYIASVLVPCDCKLC